ncbi:DUF1186 domain-containing protein [Flavobacterium sp. SUN046]|uniref:DUF1186 domain-containing protein n=1 Tax=Flavobacterium sp. SUN046 TaxID=3002440 RepID=UPI002DB925CA|nr:DUF1186 domain-containing protein [Flavobacterium sp. SUN046]MEC4050194.1 DUF1186 domain-containing protein [Flavobacterium sp. SUN046]
MKANYSCPIDQLLTYGSCKTTGKWPNYLELGFTNENVDELIKMTQDEELHNSSSESTELWAPIHAWRTLGQLKAISSAEFLLKLFSKVDDDWVNDEIPKVFEMLGPETISVIQHYIEKNEDDLYANICALNCLEKIGNEYHESRLTCIEILSTQLKKCEEQDETYNAFLVSYLVDLNATEAIEIITNAYEKNTVEQSVTGDLEEVEIELKLT